MADAQVKTLAVDSDHAGGGRRRQSCLQYIMSNRCSMVLIHMIQHAALTVSRARERIGQRHLIQPVDSTEAADETPAHRLQNPEIEIMNAVVVAGLRKIAVIALCYMTHRNVIDPLRFGQQGESPRCLNVLRAALGDQQGAARVGQ